MRNLINRCNFQTILVKFPKCCDLLQNACTSGFGLFGIKTFTQSSPEEYCRWVNKYERAPPAASFKCSGNVHQLQSVTCVMFRQNSTLLTQQLPFRGPTCSAPPTPGTACPRFQVSAPWKEVASTNTRK